MPTKKVRYNASLCVFICKANAGEVRYSGESELKKNRSKKDLKYVKGTIKENDFKEKYEVREIAKN